jgi:y4mF family transcriptional regulator
MKENLSILSKFVKSNRKKVRLTQVQLADKAGVGLRFVRDLEQGKLSLRTDTVNKVLKLFGACLGPINLPRE